MYQPAYKLSPDALNATVDKIIELACEDRHDGLEISHRYEVGVLIKLHGSHLAEVCIDFDATRIWIMDARYRVFIDLVDPDALEKAAEILRQRLPEKECEKKTVQSLGE